MSELSDKPEPSELTPKLNLTDMEALIAAGKVEVQTEDPRDNWHEGLVTRQGKRWQLTSKSSQVVTRVPETTDNTDNIHNISCH